MRIAMRWSLWLAMGWVLGAAAPALVEPRPPAVTVVSAATGTIAETVLVTGTLVAREEVLVSPQIEGLAITDIRAEEGDTVQPRQILATLSRESLDTSMAQNAAQIARAKAAIAQAQGSITEAQANRAQSDAAFARTRDLVGSGAASRETYDIRQAGAQTAVARVAAAQAALEVANADLALAQAQRQEIAVRLARTDITAPVGGVVSRRTARLGAVVSMAGDPLFRIISDGAIELEGDVPEGSLGRLRPGQPARIDAADAPDRPGRVRLVSPEVNRTSRLGRVRIAIEGGGVSIGGFARALVEVARHDGVLVPLSAVLFDTDGPHVQVVRDGVVETRRVTVGLRAERQAEITKGLAEGESVVSLAGTFVRDGDRVTPVPAKLPKLVTSPTPDNAR
jgi:RND family efflux transporter MFP subunit